jgi:hypothetical protein
MPPCSPLLLDKKITFAKVIKFHSKLFKNKPIINPVCFEISSKAREKRSPTSIITAFFISRVRRLLNCYKHSPSRAQAQDYGGSVN